MNDIYLNDVTSWQSWGTNPPPNLNVWTPISSGIIGSFDGGGFAIRGVYINNNSGNQGLFGELSHGTIINLSVKQSYIKGGENVGAIAGQLSGNAQVINCFNKGYVIGSCAGGIAGKVTGYAQVINCYNVGKVSGSGQGATVGGIAGFFDGGALLNNHSAGMVSGNGLVGGIVGLVANNAPMAIHNYCAYGFAADVTMGMMSVPYPVVSLFGLGGLSVLNTYYNEQGMLLDEWGFSTIHPIFGVNTLAGALNYTINNAMLPAISYSYNSYYGWNEYILAPSYLLVVHTYGNVMMSPGGGGLVSSTSGSSTNTSNSSTSTEQLLPYDEWLEYLEAWYEEVFALLPQEVREVLEPQLDNYLYKSKSLAA